MKPIVQSFFDPGTFTVSHVVSEPNGASCAVIDPVLDYDASSGRTSTASADLIIEYVRDRKLRVEWILETHVHADHLTASSYLREVLGGQTGIGVHIVAVQRVFTEIFNTEPEFDVDGSQFDRLFEDGDELDLGALTVTVMHTPGHTPACVTYVIGDAAFVGDTLFMPDYGTARADFPGGDATTLYESIQRVLQLSPSTRLFTCHDYLAPGRESYVWESTVADQRAGNIHIGRGRTKAEFVAMRTARDKTLSMPALILPAIQVNMRAGELPPAEANGVSYLKIPVNAL